MSPNQKMKLGRRGKLLRVRSMRVITEQLSPMMLLLSDSASRSHLMVSTVRDDNRQSFNISTLNHITFPENVKAGVLATSDPAPGGPVKAIGWGKSGSNMEAFKTLHEVDLNTHKTVMPKVNTLM